MIKNKRGDIPVTILVIGVFAICSMAIFSFVYSKGKVQEDFVGIGLIENINSIEEEIRFYESLEKTPEEIKEILKEVEFDGTYYIIQKNYGKDKNVSVEYKVRIKKDL
ncbi:hypothetical protein CMI39_02660 [Candidatus Pacearchaeota archaeon]|nr:hypothetical protein [Candidatus Pacearchaeota archaeon]|tara:strand:+ start:1183 stop:1506 length:324 start_codon:yes stop_codon:yes gene_type:complete